MKRASLFQSTLPREERPAKKIINARLTRFQSTLPREERLSDISCRRSSANFNPRSHERSDDKTNGIFIDDIISIHAPTRGATDGLYQLLYEYFISIHAPTRGATFHPCLSLRLFLYFNPRSHERSDYKQTNTNDCIAISIHAPTRGATHCLSCIYASMDFNPRSHERSDATRPTPRVTKVRFQSTLPREERPTLTVFFPVPCYFNPRSHERSDGTVYFSFP